MKRFMTDVELILYLAQATGHRWAFICPDGDPMYTYFVRLDHGEDLRFEGQDMGYVVVSPGKVRDEQGVILEYAQTVVDERTMKVFSDYIQTVVTSTETRLFREVGK
jgi:hypothetical protein